MSKKGQILFLLFLLQSVQPAYASADIIKTDIKELGSVDTVSAAATCNLSALIQNITTLELPANSVVFFWVTGPGMNWEGHASVQIGPWEERTFSVGWNVPEDAATGTYYYKARVYDAINGSPISSLSHNEYFIVIGNAPETPVSCLGIKSSSPASASGYYTIDPDGYGNNPPFKAYCDMDTDGGGWTVIDYSHSSVWKNYFRTWVTFDSNRMVMPDANTSSDFWLDWFTHGDTTTDFRTSPECTDVSSSTARSEAYAVSGNFFGCNWFNRNCDMLDATQECSECLDSWGRVRKGTCSHLVQDSNDALNTIYEPYANSCSFDWWNRNPSLGINGKFCVAYRTPSESSFTYKNSSFPWNLFIPIMINVNK